MAPCDECGFRCAGSLQEFNGGGLCRRCYQAMLSAADGLMQSMVINFNEPDRVCSKCAAMVELYGADRAGARSWNSATRGEPSATACAFNLVTAPVVRVLTGCRCHGNMWSWSLSKLKSLWDRLASDWLMHAPAPVSLEGRNLN